MLDRRSRLAYEQGKKKQAGEQQCLLQVASCSTTCAWVEVRAACSNSQQPVDGQGSGGCDEKKIPPGLPGLRTAEQSIVERTGWRLEG